MYIEWKTPTWDEWKQPGALRENKLVCFGFIAGYLDAGGHIRIPDGIAGEDALASLGRALVSAYDGTDPDDPFDLVCEETLMHYFPNTTE